MMDENFYYYSTMISTIFNCIDPESKYKERVLNGIEALYKEVISSSLYNKEEFDSLISDVKEVYNEYKNTHLKIVVKETEEEKKNIEADKIENKEDDINVNISES